MILSSWLCYESAAPGVNWLWSLVLLAKVKTPDRHLSRGFGLWEQNHRYSRSLLSTPIHFLSFSKPLSELVPDQLFLDLIHILCTFWLIWQQFALNIFPRVDQKKWFWIYFSRMDYHFFVKLFLGFKDFCFSLYSTKNNLSST